MHTSELATIMAGTSDWRWPPRQSDRDAWDKVEDYRRRVENDAFELFRYRPDLHVRGNGPASAARGAVFTPSAMPGMLARFSASLLFSEAPKIRLAGDADAPLQAVLEEWLTANKVADFLLGAAASVAALGGAAIRLLDDDRISAALPAVTYHLPDAVLWNAPHDGRYTRGGILIVTIEEEHSSVVFRLLESHEPGRIRRVLYKGGPDRLGKRHDLSAGPAEFRDLKPEQATGVDAPTLIRWENKPGGESDLAGLEPLLDSLDECLTVGRVKQRASQPITYMRRFTTRDADSLGGLPMHNIVAIDDFPARYAGSGPAGVAVEGPFPVENLLMTTQASLEADQHARYVEGLREAIISGAGYDLASWGLDREGRADSGTALRLRQSTTLRTRAIKEGMAVEAIAQMCALALAMILGRATVEPSLVPEVELSDGMPRDGREDAEEIVRLRQAGVISLEEAVRRLHSDWDEAKILAEVAKIEAAAAVAPVQPTPLASMNGGRT
jgi:hypothetical protein